MSTNMYPLENVPCGNKLPDCWSGYDTMLDVCSTGLHSNLALGILSLQQSQSATAEGFELPGAQGSGQRPEGPASGLAANAIWGFSHVEPEARTSAGKPPARVPWRYPPKGTVYPLLWGRRFLFSLHWFDFHAEDRLTPWWQVE